jgi:hypothetical protein
MHDIHCILDLEGREMIAASVRNELEQGGCHVPAGLARVIPVR